MTLMPTTAPKMRTARSQRANRPLASEHDEQAALFTWRDLMAAQIPELNLLFAVPNAAKRSPGLARWMKAEGLRSGVPDVWLPVSRGRWHGLVLEMKRSDGGAGESPEQEWWRTVLLEQGYYALVVKGWDQAKEAILRYLEGNNR